MSGADGAAGSPIQAYLERMYERYADLLEGEVANYIPELAKADKRWFSICIATIDGHVYEVGDARQPFTIQSISKPFVYGMALEDNGEQEVLSKVGVEPTGDAFNSISLDPGSGRPLNPMINAGAIAVAGLVRGESAVEKLHRILQTFSLYVGRNVTIDHVVYQSEKSTGHRNRAIGHMLRNFDILGVDPDPILDLYFQQCSIAVTCHDLALMAATLANGGVNPRTGQRVAKPEYVENMLSVMATCGMYDYAGEWIYKVGMPAKSGVSGGILAVLPGQLGVSVFSPLLDAHGNSMRGLRVCADISKDFQLHLFNAPRISTSAIRAKYDATHLASRRLRGSEEARLLKEHGEQIRIYELQGELTFTTMEPVAREVLQHLDTTESILIDLKRVVFMNDAAQEVLTDLMRTASAQGVALVLAGAHEQDWLPKTIAVQGPALAPLTPPPFADNDLALEWCEERLLSGRGVERVPEATVALTAHDLCQGLTPDELARLLENLQARSFSAGDAIIHSGDCPDHIYFLSKGTVSVTVGLMNGRRKRFSTLSAGMVFGEMALVDRLPRSADVHADTDVECYVLSCEKFEDVACLDASVRAALLRNLLRHVSRMLRRANEEVSVLAQ